MANISKIKILNGTTYDLIDPNAARASDLGGISFALSNANALLVTHENNSITAATNTTLTDISDAIGDLADIWEAAVTGESGSDTDTETSAGNNVISAEVLRDNQDNPYINLKAGEIIEAINNGKMVAITTTAMGGIAAASHVAFVDSVSSGYAFWIDGFDSVQFTAADANSYPTNT